MFNIFSYLKNKLSLADYTLKTDFEKLKGKVYKDLSAIKNNITREPKRLEKIIDRFRSELKLSLLTYSENDKDILNITKAQTKEISVIKASQSKFISDIAESMEMYAKPKTLAQLFPLDSISIYVDSKKEGVGAFVNGIYSLRFIPSVGNEFLLAYRGNVLHRVIVERVEFILQTTEYGSVCTTPDSTGISIYFKRIIESEPPKKTIKNS